MCVLCMRHWVSLTRCFYLSFHYELLSYSQASREFQYVSSLQDRLPCHRGPTFLWGSEVQRRDIFPTSHLCLCILPLSSLGKGKRFSYSHFAERCEASLGLEGLRDWYLMPAWLRLASFKVLRAMGRCGDLRAMHASQPPAVNPGMRPEMGCLQEDSSNKKGKPQKPGQKGCHNPPAWIVTTSVQGTEGRDGHLWGHLKTQKNTSIEMGLSIWISIKPSGHQKEKSRRTLPSSSISSLACAIQPCREPQMAARQ